MGTNFYVVGEACKHCGRSDPRRHIGKSSVGWVFSLHIYPDEGINTFDDWKLILLGNIYKIEDEYGNEFDPLQMMKIIADRKAKNGDEKWDKPPYGYASWGVFHLENHSMKGPHGLLRHVPDGYHCLGNGDGTFDYMIGDFS